MMPRNGTPTIWKTPVPRLVDEARRAFTNTLAGMRIGERISTVREHLLTIRFGQNNLQTFSDRKDMWLRHGRVELARGNIDPFLFTLMTSAFTFRHEDSGLNRRDYLRRVVKLYNAKTLGDVISTESAMHDRGELNAIIDEYSQKNLEWAKIHCLLRDTEIGTKKLLNVSEVKDLFRYYRAPEGERYREEVSYDDGEEELHKTYSAFEKRVLYPLIQVLYEERKIREEQVTLLLAINFHSRERRRSGERYIDHPMAVAEYVDKFADVFGLSESERSLARMAALIHDIGEKSNFNMDTDLEGIVSKDLRRVASNLNKHEDESYFGDYIGGKCITSFVESFVKLCDIYHNMSDEKEGEKSFKQAYVYPIAANYLRYKLFNRGSNLSIEDFVVSQRICTRDQFEQIKYWADHDRKIAVSEVAATIPRLRNIFPVRYVFDRNAEKVTFDYADLSGKKDSAVHPKPDF